MPSTGTVVVVVVEGEVAGEEAGGGPKTKGVVVALVEGVGDIGAGLVLPPLGDKADDSWGVIGAGPGGAAGEEDGDATAPGNDAAPAALVAGGAAAGDVAPDGLAKPPWALKAGTAPRGTPKASRSPANATTTSAV